MKTIWAFIFLMSALISAFAQEFKPFKVGLGLGIAAPVDGDGGGLIYIEPGYRVNNIILVGLRMESAIIARGLAGTDRVVDERSTSNTSYTLNGQYYFSENYIRPFVGAGFGLFSLAAIRYDRGRAVETAPAAARFGFYPRVGLDVGHFNLAVDYNFVPETPVNGGGKVKNCYLGIRGGFSIGGGRGRKTSYDL